MEEVEDGAEGDKNSRRGEGSIGRLWARLAMVFEVCGALGGVHIGIPCKVCI